MPAQVSNWYKTKYGKAAAEILRYRNISARLFHIPEVVEKESFPQNDGRFSKTHVENSEDVWEIDVFPANSRKNAVDKPGKNCGKLVGKLCKTGAQVRNNCCEGIMIGLTY